MALPFVWLFNNQPATTALAANATCTEFLSHTTVLVTYGPNNVNNVVPAAWHPVPVGQFGDWTQIPSGTRVPGPNISAFTYAMYDCENWSNTPAAQFDSSQGPGPNASAVSAITATHNAGDVSLLAPAANLASVAGNGGYADKFFGYLDIPLTASATNCDWFCVQSQELIGTRSSSGLTFYSFVREAVSRILSVNPSCKIIVGISTQNAQAVLNTEADIEEAIRTVSGLPIAGFWFNCPPAGGVPATTIVVDVISTQPAPLSVTMMGQMCG